jgi:pimeloyl-ACP methyl ester carboxylesterase
MPEDRLLLVPWLTELEWQIRPLLSWAEVASFDAPGVGEELPASEPSRDAIAKRGLEELDRLGWDRCTVVADEFGVGTAVALASERPEAVAGLALGHACLSHRLDGDRPPINPSVYEAFLQTARTNYRTFARHLTQVSRGGYDDELADRWVGRVPTHVALSYYDGVTSAERPFGELLEALDLPLLFGRHEGCIMFTPEGFADATAVFPRAKTVSDEVKPTASEKFAAALRSFCEDQRGTR